MEPPKEEVLQMENFVARLTAAAHRKHLQDKASRLDSPSNRWLHLKSSATSPSKTNNASPHTFLWQGQADTRCKHVEKVWKP